VQDTPAPAPAPLSAQDSLVALMIAVSASDAKILTAELVRIQTMLNHLPVFGDYEQSRLSEVSALVFELFEQEDGLDTLFALIRAALPERLYETAYVLCCDVAAADATLNEPELRLLEEIRYELSLDRLHAAAIERAARARHMTL
jgi:tellurite resistance protein